MLKYAACVECLLIIVTLFAFFDFALYRLLNPSQAEEVSTSFSILRVPFYGPISVKFGNRLSRIISRKFDIDVKIVYSTFKVKNYFKLKCNTPFALLSNVVYRFDCVENAQVSYIGYTKRHLVIRTDEHTVPSLAKKSHVHQHIKNCEACTNGSVGLSHFQILHRHRDETDSKIGESFAIKKHQPVLNKQLFGKGSSILLNVWK